MAKTEHLCRSIAIQTSCFHKETCLNRIRFEWPVDMIKSSRMMEALYSLSGSSRHRLMAKYVFFLYLWRARTTEPFTLKKEIGVSYRCDKQWWWAYPVPISWNPSYLLRGSSGETCTEEGKAFLIFFSNSFPVLIKGGNWGISVQRPAGRQGCLDMCFSTFIVRKKLFWGNKLGSGLRKQSLPNTFGIS